LFKGVYQKGRGRGAYTSGTLYRIRKASTYRRTVAKPAGKDLEDEEAVNGHQTVGEAAAEMSSKEAAIAAGAVGDLRLEILRLGPEVAELHLRQAAIFKEWLLEEKAIAAEIEKRRKQEAADNVSPISSNSLDFQFLSASSYFICYLPTFHQD
jgi:hypothetical protein